MNFWVLKSVPDNAGCGSRCWRSNFCLEEEEQLAVQVAVVLADDEVVNHMVAGKGY